MAEITVCIVDDNKAIRSALEEIIGMSQGFKSLGSMGSAEEAIQKLPLMNPDVVLMDINLGSEETGIDCVRELKDKMPGTNFMMCTVYEEDDKIFEALRAGASGYILKKTAPAKLLESIRELYGGGSPMSSQIARKVVALFQNNVPSALPDSNKGIDILSAREKEILELLSKGLMYKEIASQLYISQETIRKHVYHIYGKLHVGNRVEAVNKYFGR
ncbi:MAG: response regulator transcription factor [Chitinophagaceae bacterium]|jgi:DNA-binding NarL/FixJ family response regulator|nr:response regulator transcription factor [Chitinophagaceae bacterium]OQY93729.1 MAG: DNA-binding response regulator [Sphingobacteriales bacterium UTBCD1]